MAKSKSKINDNINKVTDDKKLQDNTPDITFKPSSLNFNKDAFFDKVIMNRSTLADTKKLPYERFLSASPSIKLEKSKNHNPDANTSLVLTVNGEVIPIAESILSDTIVPTLVPILTDPETGEIEYPSEKVASSKPVVNLSLYSNCKIMDLQEGPMTNMVSIEQLTDYLVRANVQSATYNLYQKTILNDLYRGITSPLSSTIARLINRDLTGNYGFATKMQTVIKQEAIRILKGSLPTISKE
jgi:hypothetical protein